MDKMRDEISIAITTWATNQINACDNVEEQAAFIKEMINVGVALWTIRFRDAPVSVQKDCIEELEDYLVGLVDDNEQTLIGDVS